MHHDILLLDFLGLDNCFWRWFLSALGAFLLGWLLHWLFFTNPLKRRIAELEEVIRGLRAKLTDAEKDHASLRYQFDECQRELTRLRAALSNCETDKDRLNARLADINVDNSPLAVTPIVSVSNNLDTSYGSYFNEDNLQVVEGIGPKIEGLLKNEGITTWAILANTSQDKLRDILNNAGPHYRIHKPDSWPKQAALARDGQWSELIDFQKFLDGGKESSRSVESKAKVEKLALKILGFNDNPDDLKIVEGIGSKIESLLKADGINNWTDLSTASVDRLKEILSKAGANFRLADPTTWPRQAELAQNRDWQALREYQDFLDGGVDPSRI